jgi:anti-sigma regulatory factor (Ser/Thr protein kinase)
MHTPATAPCLRTTQTTYPGTLETISRVRADLRMILDGCPAADDAIMCASEMAANAAQHSNSRHPGGTYTVRAYICPRDYIHIAVKDDGGPWIESSPDPLRGRGLHVVGSLAGTGNWGISHDSTHGRVVWARLAWSPDDNGQ